MGSRESPGDQVILTDLHLHLRNGDGLSTGQLPAVDYGLLLRAITTTTPTPLTNLTEPTAPPAQRRDAKAPERRRTNQPVAAPDAPTLATSPLRRPTRTSAGRARPPTPPRAVAAPPRTPGARGRGPSG